MKANSRTFMSHVVTAHWKGSQTAEWAEKAKQSYNRISERAKKKEPLRTP